MAKRAKAKTTAKARPKAEPAEPFYRPFSKLNAARSRALAERKEPEAAATGRERKRAADSQKPAPPSPPQPLPRPAPAAAAPADPGAFAVYMAGVKTLPEDRAHRIPRTASRVERADRTAPTEDADADARDRMGSLVTEGVRFETVDDGERLEGRRIDVDPRDLRRLRRGQYAVDGKLDLHGLGADEARRAVEAFVKKRATDGDRVVLVVHGKGSHSPRGHAVLRGEIAAWLSQGRSARHVAAFSTAPDAGALLVLLAR